MAGNFSVEELGNFPIPMRTSTPTTVQPRAVTAMGFDVATRLMAARPIPVGVSPPAPVRPPLVTPSRASAFMFARPTGPMTARMAPPTTPRIAGVVPAVAAMLMPRVPAGAASPTNCGPTQEMVTSVMPATTPAPVRQRLMRAPGPPTCDPHPVPRSVAPPFLAGRSRVGATFRSGGLGGLGAIYSEADAHRWCDQNRPGDENCKKGACVAGKCVGPPPWTLFSKFVVPVITGGGGGGTPTPPPPDEGIDTSDSGSDTFFKAAEKKLKGVNMPLLVGGVAAAAGVAFLGFRALRKRRTA